jgi:hypothetical protein
MIVALFLFPVPSCSLAAVAFLPSADSTKVTLFFLLTLSHCVCSFLFFWFFFSFANAKRRNDEQAALPQGIVPFVFAKEYNVHPDILSTA